MKAIVFAAASISHSMYIQRNASHLVYLGQSNGTYFLLHSKEYCERYGHNIHAGVGLEKVPDNFYFSPFIAWGGEFETEVKRQEYAILELSDAIFAAYCAEVL